MNNPTPASKPLFSVVIATYNYGHLLERAIQSVLQQSFLDFELIVVDDGSTDETPSLLARYKQELRYVRKENGGQSSAYNRGADEASGEFVYILDADDEMLPDTLARFSEAIEKQRGSGTDRQLYYGGYVSVSDTGKEKQRQAVQAPVEPKERFKAFLRQRLTGLQNGSFITPRELFKEIRYPEGLRHNTDLVFIAQALTRLPAKAIQETVLHSHEHPLRTRKQSERNIAQGTASVEALFDPTVIPAEFMPLKKVFLAQRYRSMARMMYLQGAHREARDNYFRAFSSYAPVMAQFSTIKRFLVASWKCAAQRSEEKKKD